MGSSETRSHDYYGQFMYWFSLGLSMHRVHHEQPHLTWVELRSYVRPAPVRLTMQNDRRLEGSFQLLMVTTLERMLASRNSAGGALKVMAV